MTIIGPRRQKILDPWTDAGVPDVDPGDGSATTYGVPERIDEETLRWLNQHTAGFPTVTARADQQVRVTEPEPGPYDQLRANEAVQRELHQLRARGAARIIYAAEQAEAARLAMGEQASRLVDGGSFLFDVPALSDGLWGEGRTILWQRGEALMIAGGQGLGKTVLAGQLLRALVGLSAEVLGMKVQALAGPVLYLAMDRPEQARRSMARQFHPDEREVVAGMLKFWKGPPVADFGVDPEAMLRMVDEAGCAAVIVDSIKDAALGLSDDRVGGAYNRARQLVLAHGVEVLELHHVTKGGKDGGPAKTINDVYGSTWLTSGAGSVLFLHGEPGDPVVSMSHLKQPMDELPPTQIIHDPVTGLSAVYHNADTDLIELARNSAGNGITARDSARAIYSTEEPTSAQCEKARRELDKKAKAGLLVQIPSTGGKGRGNVARWLPAAGGWMHDQGDYRQTSIEDPWADETPRERERYH